MATDDDDGDDTEVSVYEGNISLSKMVTPTEVVTCTITIIEDPEKGLQILGNLPLGSDGTVGGALAYNLLQVARVMMNHAAQADEEFEHTQYQ